MNGQILMVSRWSCKNTHMSNIVTFSAGSVDLNAQPVPSLPEGMSEDRARELLQGSTIGRDVLFYGTSEGAKAGWLTRAGAAIRDKARTGYHVAKEALTGAAKGLGGGALVGTLATAPTGVGALPGAVGGGMIGAIAGGAIGAQSGKNEIAARKSSEKYHAGQLAHHAAGLNKAISEKDAAVNARDHGKLYGKSDTAAADKRIRDAHAKIKEHADAITHHKEGLVEAKSFFSEESAVEFDCGMHDDYEQAAIMHKEAAKEAKTLAIASGEGPASEFERQAYKHEELARQYEYMAAHSIVAEAMGECNE